MTNEERLTKENDYLRGLIPKLTGKCVHCGLENMGLCKYGFPGCAWADDIMCAEDEVMKRLLRERSEMAALVRKADPDHVMDCAAGPALLELLKPTIDLLKDVVHGPEAAWNRWLYRRDEELIRLEGLIQ